MAHPTERVKVVDRLRGFSISCMLISHMMIWVKPSESWWFTQGLFALNVLGGALFLFVAGSSMTLSMRKHPDAPSSIQHLRSFIIFAAGLIYNSASTFILTAWNIWAYLILMSIGLARFVGYYAIKLPVWARCVLIGVIVVAARPLILALVGADHFANGGGSLITPTGGTISSVLGWLLFNQAPQNTFFPYFAFFLAGTVFSDLILLPSRETKRRNIRFCMIACAILLTVGLTWGFLSRTTIDLGDRYQFHVFFNTGIYPPDFPEIVSRNSLPWSLWALGTQLFVGLLFLNFEHWEYRQKTLRIYGEFSLTIYIFSELLYLVANGTWPLWFGLINIAGMLYLIGFLCNIWENRWKSRYSFEWFITVVVKNFTQKLVKNGVGKEEKPSLAPLLSPNNSN